MTMNEGDICPHCGQVFRSRVEGLETRLGDCEDALATVEAAYDRVEGLERLLMAVEEVDNAWQDSDGSEWTFDEDVFELRLSELRRAYGAYTDDEYAAPTPVEPDRSGDARE
jgi:hypothetical protein